MITVEVMYDDLSIKKYSPSEFTKSQKDKILFILFKDDGKNVISLSGFDYYGIKITENEISFLQYNVEDGMIYTFDSETKQCCDGSPQERDRWIPKDFLIFEGKQVTNWNEAVEKFQREMSNPK